MLTSSIFGENMFGEFLRNPFFDSKDMKRLKKKLYGRRGKNLMKTGIHETDIGYELETNLPGSRRDGTRTSLRDKYLTINAAKGLDEDEQKKTSGRYIHQECYVGAYEKGFYVDEGMTKNDIEGEFKHDILRLSIPKREARPLAEEKEYIPIER